MINNKDREDKNWCNPLIEAVIVGNIIVGIFNAIFILF